MKEEAPRGLLYSLTFVWAGALSNIDSAVYGAFLAVPDGGRWRSGCRNTGVRALVPRQRGDMFHFVVTWPSWFPLASLAGREVFPPIWNLADAAISVSVIWMLMNQKKYFPTVN